MVLVDAILMQLGYNTNGFAHHCLEDVVPILAEIGYQSIAITLDHHVLNPFSADLSSEVARVRDLLRSYHLHSVIETGARFLLDSRNKHEPTLVSSTPAGRARRVDFLRRAIDIAAELGSDAVSFWSGSLRDERPRDETMKRLIEACRQVLDHAIVRNVKLAFEPEPGMFIARMADYEELLSHVDQPLFGLTIDIGHVHCLSDGLIPDVLGKWQERLFNVHIEDMCRGKHDHLMFSEGEIDFPPVLRKLRDIRFEGGVHVELSRHSHDAVNVARRSFQFLDRMAG
jgi:L-ribulose-5-phosphate 3-epimerase